MPILGRMPIGRLHLHLTDAKLFLVFDDVDQYELFPAYVCNLVVESMIAVD